MTRRIIPAYEPVKASAMKPGDIAVREDEGESDRVTIHANGIVVDVISNLDGSVYVECYAYGSDKQAVVQHAAIDRYKTVHPNLRIDLVDRP